MIRICPSLISSNLLNLSQTITELEPHSDGFHLDIMDDHFVPNLTWGHMFINAIAHKTMKPLFVHLMVEQPELWPQKLELNDNDTVIFHLENKINHYALIKNITEKKWHVGLAIRPKTPIEEILPYLKHINLVVLMSVEPGFSGQSFLESSIERLKLLVSARNEFNPSLVITMDGGINEHNIAQLAQAGVDQVAMASALFSTGDAVQNIQTMRNKIKML